MKKSFIISFLSSIIPIFIGFFSYIFWMLASPFGGDDGPRSLVNYLIIFIIVSLTVVIAFGGEWVILRKIGLKTNISRSGIVFGIVAFIFIAFIIGNL